MKKDIKLRFFIQGVGDARKRFFRTINVFK